MAGLERLQVPAEFVPCRYVFSLIPLLLSSGEGQAVDIDLKGKYFICMNSKTLIKHDCFPTTLCDLLFCFTCGVFCHHVTARKSESSLPGNICGGIYFNFNHLNLSQSPWIAFMIKGWKKVF